jgi:hypothetical protein
LLENFNSSRCKRDGFVIELYIICSFDDVRIKVLTDKNVWLLTSSTTNLFYVKTHKVMWLKMLHTALQMPSFSCGQSTIQPKFPIQVSVFPFRQKGCTFMGSMLSHSPINNKENALKMSSINPVLNVNKIITKKS